MPSSLRRHRVDRARPLLGTLVTISCLGLPRQQAHSRIEDAFAVIGDVHRLMSFHEPTSDLTHLNQTAAAGPVQVDPRTFAVLSLALEVAAASAGAFDISVAERLVAWGRLPPPPGAPTPDPAASWRDIELLEGDRVRFHRPLWIDLGGIAKGFAVDRAIQRLADDPSVRWVVNAGGDLRAAGPGSERVLLQTHSQREDKAAVIDLENASLASSSGRGFGGRTEGETVGPHVDGRGRRAVGGRSFVSVLAQDCAVADALTKVVLALRSRAGPVLERYSATAFLHDARGGWKTLGARA